MRILSFSDLHIEYNSKVYGQDITDELAACIREHRPDHVVVAGDMAGGAENCIRFLETLEAKSGVPHHYIPGNHSIWTLDKEADSWREYEQLKAHHTSLIDRPLDLGNGWVLLGDMGWYDYSFREPQMTREQVFRDKELAWKDSVLARFGMTDEEVTELMMDKFRTQLDQHRDKQVIFVNHFIPYRDYVPVSQHNKVWNLIRPFMGSAALGDLLDASPQVRYVIFGHVHYRSGTKQRGEQTVICNPLGYVKEWHTQDLATEVRSSATVIDI